MKLSDLDKNFQMKIPVNLDNLEEYDVCKPPFKVYGLYMPNAERDRFMRLPRNIANSVSEGVAWLSLNTSGGRVRFATDSKRIVLKVGVDNVGRQPYFSLLGTTGLDIYEVNDEGYKYLRTFVPPYDVEKGFITEELTVSDGKVHDYIINFPQYSDTVSLHILLEKDARVMEGKKYTYEKPIVYYGSSITQGGCASRPGNSYQNMISRRFDTNYINLGFSGNCKGELNMADYIRDIDMSIFVYDYDHNSNGAEYLEKTHEAFLKRFREKQPLTPVICVSKPDYRDWVEDDRLRRDIIIRTVENAKANGDKNIYFVDGKTICERFGAFDAITVDTCHPNDLGFWCMAAAIGDVIEKLL